MVSRDYQEKYSSNGNRRGKNRIVAVIAVVVRRVAATAATAPRSLLGASEQFASVDAVADDVAAPRPQHVDSANP